MDVITLSLAKKYANKVAAGFSSVQVDGSNLIFTLNDGTKATMTIPAPENGNDGISVVNLSIDTDGSLLCHMSDGSTIDAGKVPTIKPEQVQVDWNQNDSTQPDYVKNRICYVNYFTNTLIDNKTFTFTKNPYKQFIHNFTEEEKLDPFTYETNGEVIFNGVRYPAFRNYLIESDMFSGYYANVDGATVHIFNDLILINQYPSDSDNVDITITFSLLDENIVKLPEKYLPDTVATKEYVDNNSSQQVQSDWSQNDPTQPDYIKNRFGGYEDYAKTVILEEMGFDFIDGVAEYLGIDKKVIDFNTIEIVVDGISHIAVQDMTGAMQIIYSGYSSVGTYVQYSYDADHLALLEGFEDDIHMVAIYGLPDEPTIVKIPEQYLPETIATKQYVDDIFNNIVNGDEVAY